LDSLPGVPLQTTDPPESPALPLQAIFFDAARTFFAARPDKEWSLTDCISFVALNERGIIDALTNDHHFEQADFRILLKD
jgi:predicted nucleic acid-binding protein